MDEQELIDLVIMERIDMLYTRKREKTANQNRYFLKRQNLFSRSSPKRSGIS
ncbi:hypothetical protein [Lacrimispora sphenoides]|uniref:hypothetical protein n=1 Tax=Lacrimispora sphenoides TaxID=29370 RepID=UPI0012FD4FCD|nr:hypothetical protein [Lacrimispora sphenoides]